jgi:glycosyltransferase involved in cell wall biosynthesis
MDDPRVSVVIPVYNREEYVGAAIESVLAQTFTDFEVLVIDDGSTDRSRDMVQRYRDPRVRLVCHDGNQGIPKTRNTGVGAARGSYLAFLDSDDIAYPTRLAKQATFLDRHPDHAAVGAWVDWMDASGRPLGRVKRWPATAQEVAAQRLFRQGIENTASMACTAVLREFRHDERFAVSEDFELWARIASAHRIANLPEVLVRRRAHDQQTNRGKDDQTQYYRQAIYARQLDALGIAFDQCDLARHCLLRGMQKRGVTPDREYVDWAEPWLLTLQTANAHALCYPEPAFSHVLGENWLRVCWHSSTVLGWPTAWQRFRASPLSTWAWRGLRSEVFLTMRRPSRLSTGTMAWLRAWRGLKAGCAGKHGDTPARALHADL